MYDNKVLGRRWRWSDARALHASTPQPAHTSDCTWYFASTLDLPSSRGYHPHRYYIASRALTRIADRCTTTAGQRQTHKPRWETAAGQMMPVLTCNISRLILYNAIRPWNIAHFMLMVVPSTGRGNVLPAHVHGNIASWDRFHSKGRAGR